MPKQYRPRARVALDILLEDFLTFSEEDGEPGHATYEVIPRSVTVTRNDFRTADTVELELDYRDLPLDPRTIQDCRIDVWMGHTNDATEPNISMTDDYRIFSGYLDDPSTSFDNGGEIVKLRGRDFTALYLDKKWSGASQKSIRVNRPLDEVIAEIMDLTPGGESDEVPVAMDQAVKDAYISDALGRTIYSPKPGDDHWTIMVEMCGYLGLIPYFDLDTLRITTIDSVGELTARFLYGQNVSHLEYSRKLNGITPHQIRLIAFDQRASTRIESIYPKEAIVKKRRRPAKNGKTKTDYEAVRQFFMPGSPTQADLDALAELMYVEGSRRELEGRLETFDMSDLDDEQALWMLKNGDALTVYLGNTIASSISGMTASEKVAYLTSPPRNFNPVAAAALVDSLENGTGSHTQFYITSATHHWGRAEGYRLEATFTNNVLDAGGQT